MVTFFVCTFDVSNGRSWFCDRIYHLILCQPDDNSVRKRKSEWCLKGIRWPDLTVPLQRFLVREGKLDGHFLERCFLASLELLGFF